MIFLFIGFPNEGVIISLAHSKSKFVSCAAYLLIITDLHQFRRTKEEIKPYDTY